MHQAGNPAAWKVSALSSVRFAAPTQRNGRAEPDARGSESRDPLQEDGL